MENNSEHLLEKYFANALSSAERSELQQMLSNDPALRQELAWQQNLGLALRSKSLRDGLQDPALRDAVLPPQPAVRRNLFLLSLAAAASVVALVAAVWFFSLPKDPVENALATNLSHYPNRMDFRSLGGPEAGQEAPPDAVRRAFELYDDSTNYHRSAEALSAVVQQYPDRLAYRFYYGCALLRDKQYTLAIYNLQPVAAADDNAYQAAANFQLGLAYAGAHQYAQARTTLQEFLQAPNTLQKYRQPAENVLRALPKQ
ncbi:MAG: hypothetical protein ABIQ93_16390 [Saprospiraceae bacterium]